MLRALVGSFIGKVLATVFVAVCLFLGFGPSKWAEWLVGHMMTPQVAQVGFVALGVVSGVLVIAGMFVKPAPIVLPPTQAPTPDWTIRELFYHIDPAVYEEDESGPRWQKAGNDVLDKLAIGQMDGWGRLDEGHRPMTHIRRDYWHDAEWTFWFVSTDPKSQQHAHVTRVVGGYPKRLESYRDVRVNRAQCEALWPSPPRSWWWSFRKA